MGNASSKRKQKVPLVDQKESSPLQDPTAPTPVIEEDSHCQTELEQQQVAMHDEEKPDADAVLEMESALPAQPSHSCENADMVEEIECPHDLTESMHKVEAVEQQPEDIQPDRSRLHSNDLLLQDPFVEAVVNTTVPVEVEKVSLHAEEEAACLEIIRELCSPTVSYSLSSDQWAHRKEGLELIQKYIDRCKKLDDMMTESIIDEFYAIAVILRKFFDDRVAPVYYAAYDCFRALLKVYGSYVSGPRVEDMLRSMVTPLLTSMGGEATGTNRRTQKEACRCVLRVARLTHVDGLGVVVPLLSAEDIPLRPRLALLKLLVQEFRMEQSSNGNCASAICIELVMCICQPALANSDDKVRKAAVDVIGIAYGMVGQAIKTHISDVKPAVLKVLETKFAEIDGTEPPAPSVSSSPQQASFKKSRSKKGLLSRKGSASGSAENIRNLAPVMLNKSGSFSRNDSNKSLRASFGSSSNFGNGGMECEIYVPKAKPKNPAAACSMTSTSPQHNSPDDKTSASNVGGNCADLEGVNRQLFMDEFVEGQSGPGSNALASNKKGSHLTPSKGNATPGVHHDHAQPNLDDRFVISESVC